MASGLDILNVNCLCATEVETLDSHLQVVVYSLRHMVETWI